LGSNKNISRKEFITGLGQVTIALFAGLWMVMTKKTLSTKLRSGMTLTLSQINDGITFFDDVISYKEGEVLTFFSSRCTHLGCKITQHQSDRLICPCHGSRFDSRTGKAIIGPALYNLPVLDYEQNSEEQSVTVFIK